MIEPAKITTIHCNTPPNITKGRDHLIFDYRDIKLKYNIRIKLPGFVERLLHLPDRVLDLLEIAAYVYAADRSVSRGQRRAVEYQSWSRSFQFRIRVRDREFWNRPEVLKSLQEALVFITGDLSYAFEFYSGHKTAPTNLFDQQGTTINLKSSLPAVALFSGGLDSLAGAINLLSTTDFSLLLVSHQTQNTIKRTQGKLIKYLTSNFPDRIYHYSFECHLSGNRAVEESQRSRMFLYSSIAAAVAIASGLKDIHVFENGVTSINLLRRQDLINARASRTTHPKSIYLLRTLLDLVAEGGFNIRTPFVYKTKKDIFDILLDSPHSSLIASTVSCSRTMHKPKASTHCGECFQCLDRRLAAHAAEGDEIDHNGLYANNIIAENIQLQESMPTIVDYIRQGVHLENCGADWFSIKYINDLADLIYYMPTEDSEKDAIEKIWTLYERHGRETVRSISKMRAKYDDITKPLAENSLLAFCARREHLKEEAQRLASRISQILTLAIPKLFRSVPPRDERDLNSKISALLAPLRDSLRSEYPSASFACSGVVPDHLFVDDKVAVEVKYIRSATTPARISDGVAADLVKYPKDHYKLFIIYDPERSISDDKIFVQDFEALGSCMITIIR